jgi:hypothetical protein
VSLDKPFARVNRFGQGAELSGCWSRRLTGSETGIQLFCQSESFQIRLMKVSLDQIDEIHIIIPMHTPLNPCLRRLLG